MKKNVIHYLLYNFTFIDVFFKSTEIILFIIVFISRSTSFDT